MSLKCSWTGNGYISGFCPTLLAELSVREASNAIREKLYWWHKIKDPTVVANWRRELLEESSKREERFHMTEEQIDYVFKELDWFAQKSQEQIDNGAEAMIDHPGSDEKVLALVHPSLFPFVAGQTRVTDKEAIPPLDFITTGKILNVAPVPKSSKADSTFYSKTHQWLPTDFDITPEGKVKARLYINNLHPVEYKDMYPVLEEILEKFLPMFEEVLVKIADFPPNKLKANRYWCGPLPEFEEAQDYDWDKDEDKDEEGGDDGQGERPPKAAKESKESKEPKEPKGVKMPSTSTGRHPRIHAKKRPHTYNLRIPGKPLQVIVNLANIELIPTSQRLATQIPKEPDYVQSDDRGTKHLYGVKNHDLLRQRLDGVETKQDRCLVFPNIFQHKIQSFRLADPTKPGCQMNNKLPPEPLCEVDRMVDCPITLGEAKRHCADLMVERRYFPETIYTDLFKRPFSLCEH
ncbi:hypothetical protein BGZ47_010667 [Haplosporangium gracile]|nr:hypothetical protein BGZ47_010667 [Haplosporangium gracile]